MQVSESQTVSATGSNYPQLSLAPTETRDWVRALHDFISSHRELCNAHTVDFLTKEHWKNLVRGDWKDELKLVEDTDYLVHPRVKGTNGSLQEFLYTASHLRLPVQPLEASKPLQFGMTPKKSHEVYRASQFIASITASQGVKQVLDLGSGKGYLSQHLSLRYGLTVVGMDSHGANTDGALKRNRKVCKAWKGTKSKETLPTDSIKTGVGESVTAPSTAMELEGDWALDSLFDCGGVTPCGTPNVPVTTEVKTTGILSHEEQLQQQHNTNSEATVSCAVAHGNSRAFHGDSGTVRVPSYFPITKEVGVFGSADILHEAEVKTSAAFSATQPCCLVGLHTCGDLAASCLRLFVQLPAVTVTCVVGCCYNLITEIHEEGGGVPGFPMSAYLRSLGGGLGRTARMLACQTLCKIAHTTRGDNLKVGMFRAIFQVLLMRKLAVHEEDSPTHFMVGKQRHVPHNFEEYARVASGKVGLDVSDVPDEELRDLYAEFAVHLHELEKFLQLRAVIAPCIESLIILDRLLYIQEQDTTREAYLVQLFDPTLSPRCFGIVAYTG